MGLAGGALKTINKLFGGALGDTDAILENTKKRLKALDEEGALMKGLPGKMQGLGVMASEVGKSITSNLNDPLMYLKIALDYSDQINFLYKTPHIL